MGILRLVFFLLVIVEILVFLFLLMKVGFCFINVLIRYINL